MSKLAHSNDATMDEIELSALPMAEGIEHCRQQCIKAIEENNVERKLYWGNHAIRLAKNKRNYCQP